MAEIHSFKEYIKDKYENELFEKMNDYVRQNPERVCRDCDEVDYPEEAEVADFEIKFTSVDDAPGEGITFIVVVDAELEVVQEGRHHTRETVSTDQWLKLDCTASISSDGMRDLMVCDVSVYSEYDRKKHGILTDHMVPLIYGSELEDVAEDFLSRYYPEALEVPMAVDPYQLAKNMGLKVKETHLTKTCTVFGQMCFKDCEMEYYDTEDREFKKAFVEKGTILLDPKVFFMRNLGSVNNTIAHECVHWDKHRKFFELQSLFNPDACSIRCQVTESTNRKNERTEYEWMEWQASALAPRILMPKKTVIVKIRELIEKNRQLLPNGNRLDIYESVIFELAEFYGVSKQAAKIRMLDLGYEEVHGVLTYVDERYIENYAFEAGSIKRGETYTIGMIDALIQIRMKPDFADLLESGQFLYIDSHFCINDSKYISTDKRGVAHMTDYARLHIDECCLIFKAEFKENKKYGASYYTECFLYRDALVDALLEVSYANLPQNSSVIDRAEQLAKEAELCAKIIEKLSPTFGGSVKKLMELYDVSEIELGEQALLSSKTIERLKNPKGRLKYKTVVQLCLGMHLHPILSDYLIKQSGVDARVGAYEDIAYKLLLTSGWRKDIREINEELKSTQIDSLAFKDTDG